MPVRLGRSTDCTSLKHKQGQALTPALTRRARGGGVKPRELSVPRCQENSTTVCIVSNCFR